MLLAVDIGNTNIVLGCVEADKIMFEARIKTDASKTYEQYAVEIKNIIKLFDVKAIDFNGAILSSVVPPLSGVLRDAVKIITGITPMIVGPGIKTGLNILMDNPAQLGSDLVVNAVAAINEYELPLIVIDMGTATTISVINRQGNYIGGTIMPGAKLSLDALSARTAQLPHIFLKPTKSVIGKNTIDCMNSGIVNGNAAMIDGMVDRIEDELGEKATVVATGGLASSIVPYCRKQIVCDNSLLIKGLKLLYKKNTKY